MYSPETSEDEDEHYNLHKFEDDLRSLEFQSEHRTPLSHWYGCRHVGRVKLGYDEVTELVRYDAALLVTVRMLFVRTGTILKKSVLWMEEGITMGTFLMSVCFVSVMIHLEGFEQMEATLGLHTKHMQDFCKAITQTCTFLMTFFTSINFTRWQRLRHEGVEQMWKAAGQLSMVMSTCVTDDARVLSAIERYTRASLMLIPMSQRGSTDLSILAERGVLFPDEVEKLRLAGEPMFASMSIWTWLAAIVSGINDMGMIKSAQVNRYLIDSVVQGHEASHLIVTQLTAPVPLSYVWLISFIVRIHNLVYPILYGIIVVVGLWEPHRKTACGIHSLFLLMVTVLFQALLLLNQELADPFDGLSQDVGFPMTWLDRKIRQDTANYGRLAASLPNWVEAAGITRRKPKLP